MHIMVHSLSPLSCSRFLPLQPDISASDRAAQVSYPFETWRYISAVTNRLSESDIQRCAGRVL